MTVKASGYGAASAGLVSDRLDRYVLGMIEIRVYPIYNVVLYCYASLGSLGRTVKRGDSCFKNFLDRALALGGIGPYDDG